LSPTPPPPLPRQACSPRCPAPNSGRRPGGSLQRAARVAAGYAATGSTPPPVGSTPSPVNSTPPRVPSPCRPAAEEVLHRPQTHCGVVQRRPLDEEEQEEDDEPECSAAGAAARALAGDCKSCMKLRLRLGHEERARVKAQEQLHGLHAENLRLRSQLRSASSSTLAGKDEQITAAVPPTPCRIRPVSARSFDSPETAQDACGVEGSITGPPSPLELDAAGRTLEVYRREVELLRESLRERDRREASFDERQREQRKEYEAAKQEWQAQLAGLVCEVQDLEARNSELQTSLHATRNATSPSDLAAVDSSTTVSARGGTSGAISVTSSEAWPSRSPSCCDDAPGAFLM